MRTFAFSLTVVAAGTDKGVFVSQDGGSWSQSGLANASIDALAVAAVHPPIRMFAGSDGPLSAGTLPMFQTADGGATWSTLNPAISGTYVVKLERLDDSHDDFHGSFPAWARWQYAAWAVSTPATRTSFPPPQALPARGIIKRRARLQG